MKSLLNEKNSVYFQEKYPIFFKNKLLKRDGHSYYYTNPIDNALEHNQVRAVNDLINYIVNYQNNFISSYMFTKNLPILMGKGIPVDKLISSKIFSYYFDFDNWPGNHIDEKYCIRPYNGNFFDLREHYDSIFYDFIPLEDMPPSEYVGKKIYKVKYSINLLA